MEKNKKGLLIAVISIIVIVLIVVGLILFVNMNKNFDYYLSNGQYKEAIEKAKSDEEKQYVKEQNAIDYINRKAFSKAPVLSDQMWIEKAWLNKENNCLLLAYRDIDNNLIYEYFNYNTEKKDYNVVCSAVNDITIEKIEISDKSIITNMRDSVKSYGYSSGVADLGEYTLKKTLTETLTKIMAEENLVDKNCIENVNNFSKNKITEEIELLIAK